MMDGVRRRIDRGPVSAGEVERMVRSSVNQTYKLKALAFRVGVIRRSIDQRSRVEPAFVRDFFHLGSIDLRILTKEFRGESTFFDLAKDYRDGGEFPKDKLMLIDLEVLQRALTNLSKVRKAPITFEELSNLNETIQNRRTQQK